MDYYIISFKIFNNFITLGFFYIDFNGLTKPIQFLVLSPLFSAHLSPVTGPFFCLIAPALSLHEIFVAAGCSAWFTFRRSLICVLCSDLIFILWWKRGTFDGLKRWLIFVYVLLSYTTSIDGSGTGAKVLRAGEELFKETLPLQNGARVYHLQGLRPHMWYEVKISYPASIPSRFTLQLSGGKLDCTPNRGRKLLNTEKLIFKIDGMISLIDQNEMSVLVNVEPEGFIAMPGKQEQESVIFNIVCDEFLLGIPRQVCML